MNVTTTPWAFYGMFREGYLNHSWHQDALGAYAGPCVIPGILYGYGCARVVPGDGRVRGDLWYPHPESVEEAFRYFDEVEGYWEAIPYQSGYIRTLVQLLEPDVKAWVYFDNPRWGIDEERRHPTGDWLDAVPRPTG